MWAEHDVVQDEQFLLYLRFPLIDIQAGSADLTIAQGLCKGLFIDNRPPGGIDENRAFFHDCEFADTDQVMCQRCQRDMDGDKVGLAEKYIQAGKGGAGLLFEIGPRVVCSIENLHAEPLRTSCNGLSDASCADNAYGFAGHLDT